MCTKSYRIRHLLIEVAYTPRSYRCPTRLLMLVHRRLRSVTLWNSAGGSAWPKNIDSNSSGYATSATPGVRRGSHPAGVVTPTASAGIAAPVRARDRPIAGPASARPRAPRLGRGHAPANPPAGLPPGAGGHAPAAAARVHPQDSPVGSAADLAHALVPVPTAGAGIDGARVPDRPLGTARIRNRLRVCSLAS